MLEKIVERERAQSSPIRRPTDRRPFSPEEREAGRRIVERRPAERTRLIGARFCAGLVSKQEEQGAQAKATDVDGQEPVLRRLQKNEGLPSEPESRCSGRRGRTAARFSIFRRGEVRIRLRRARDVSP